MGKRVLSSCVLWALIHSAATHDSEDTKTPFRGVQSPLFKVQLNIFQIKTAFHIKIDTHREGLNDFFFKESIVCFYFNFFISPSLFSELQVNSLIGISGNFVFKENL